MDGFFSGMGGGNKPPKKKISKSTQLESMRDYVTDRERYDANTPQEENDPSLYDSYDYFIPNEDREKILRGTKDKKMQDQMQKSYLEDMGMLDKIVKTGRDLFQQDVRDPELSDEKRNRYLKLMKQLKGK